MLVFLSASAPADIISTEVRNGLLLTKYFFEKFHARPYIRLFSNSKARFWLKIDVQVGIPHTHGYIPCEAVKQAQAMY